jgi:hypothetical protein
MNKKIITLLAIFAAAMLVFFDCSNPALSGGGTEGGNVEQVAGLLMTSEGGVAVNTQVALIPGAYNPASSSSGTITLDTTSANGDYQFLHVDTGVYNIQAVDLNKRTRVFKGEIHLAGRSVQIPVDTLEKPGMIRVQLIDAADSLGGYIYIPGSTIIDSFSSNTGHVILDSVPHGMIHSLCFEPRQSSGSSTILAKNIPVSPESTTIVSPYEAWSFSKKLYLNTTSSGAGVQGNVVHFPVLVKLSGNNFDFTQAKTKGEDLRFAKSNGVPLAYEIEQWDASQGSAVIWVNVDTVYGNSSSHYFTMYWGASAGPASNSAAVFDTTYGNRGVWHLGPGLSDATIFNDIGIDSSTSDAFGIIGPCRHFNPLKHSFITIPNESRFDLTSNITMSAWVLVDTVTVQWQTIVAKGDNTYRLHLDSAANIACFSMTISDTSINHGFRDVIGKTSMYDHAWHLVCGVFDGLVMRTYVDGVMENEKTMNMPCEMDNMKLTIGDNRGRTPRYFYGSIDEVRVIHSVVNADWVKLCFMNQKASGDALVVFK